MSRTATKTYRKYSWHNIKKDFVKNWPLLLMVAPALAFYIIFHYIPMGGLLMAFENYKPNLGLLGSKFVGMKNFVDFFSSVYCWRVIRNTLILSLLQIGIEFPFTICFAILLNEIGSAKYKRTVQTISYMPHFVSWVVVAAMMQKIFSPYGGMVNEIRQALDPGAKAVYYLGKPKYFYWFVILSDIWKGCGWGTIIYLAALSGIDPSLYEAAVIDGARPMQMVARITLPLMYPTICIMLIMNLGNILNVGYEQLLQIQTTPTEHLAEVIDTYVIRKGLTSGSHSYATAIGLTKSVITLFLVVTVNRISDRFSGISLF